jgi:hypothetical protein
MYTQEFDMKRMTDMPAAQLYRFKLELPNAVSAAAPPPVCTDHAGLTDLSNSGVDVVVNVSLRHVSMEKEGHIKHAWGGVVMHMLSSHCLWLSGWTIG